MVEDNGLQDSPTFNGSGIQGKGGTADGAAFDIGEFSRERVPTQFHVARQVGNDGLDGILGIAQGASGPGVFKRGLRAERQVVEVNPKVFGFHVVGHILVVGTDGLPQFVFQPSNLQAAVVNTAYGSGFGIVVCVERVERVEEHGIVSGCFGFKGFPGDSHRA